MFSYGYTSYQAERAKTQAEQREADAQLGQLLAALAQLLGSLAQPVRALRGVARRLAGGRRSGHGKPGRNGQRIVLHAVPAGLRHASPQQAGLEHRRIL
jgi:hypothetical protein